MKNISIVINAVLIIAVGILYYLHFSCNKSCQTPVKKAVKESRKIKNDSSAARIAYVDLDSLNERISFINILFPIIKEGERSFQNGISDDLFGSFFGQEQS